MTLEDAIEKAESLWKSGEYKNANVEDEAFRTEQPWKKGFIVQLNDKELEAVKHTDSDAVITPIRSGFYSVESFYPFVFRKDQLWGNQK